MKPPPVRPHAAPHSTNRMGGSGRLIVFEGADGVGKTTLSKSVAKKLALRGERCEWHSFPGRVPGTIGELVYGLHHEPTSRGVVRLTPSALQALHIAAHLDAIESIFLPFLRAGGSLVLDRFWWSTWVYGVTTGVSESLLKSLLDAEVTAWAGFRPKAVFLLTRDRSLRTDGNRGWEALNRVYRDLAEMERKHYPVNVLQNYGSLETITRQVLHILAKSADTNDERR